MPLDVAEVPREELPATLLQLAADERLVAYVRAGSERAFEAIFDRHHDPVLAFCRHMLGSSADAEDAVQHTFFAAYRDLMRSEKPIALRPWLYTIARHRCLSMLRERRDRPVAELPEPASDHLAAEVAVREELRTTLTDVARLPEDQRAALVLAELGDASHDEIARVIGCRRDKVKALVFQARSSLTADRAARETPCAEIREQLATAGGTLRHTRVQRHLRECAGCRTFRHAVQGERRRLRVFLPFVPGFGLKRALLGLVSGWGGAGAGGAGVTAGAVSGGGLAVAVLVTAAVSGGAGAATATGEEAERTRPVSARTTAAQVAPAGTGPGTRTERQAVAPPPRDRTGTHVRDAAGRQVAPPVVPQVELRSPAPADGAARHPAPDPAAPAPAPEQEGERPENGAGAAPDAPAEAPVEEDQPRAVAPKPAKPPHPEMERPATPAPAKDPGKPPSAPSPATPALPEPGPPEHSNAGGAGQGIDEVRGHKGEGGKL